MGPRIGYLSHIAFINRRRTTWAGVPSASCFALVVLLSSRLALSQIGSTPQQAQSWVNFRSQAQDDKWDGICGTESWTGGSNHRFGETFDGSLSFVDGKLASIRFSKSLPGSIIVECLDKFNWHVHDGTVKRIRWQYDPRFQLVFPPLGKAEAHSYPLMRAIGQRKTITVDRKTGVVLSEGSWESVGIPTGMFHSWLSGDSLAVIVLVSDDGQMYTLLESQVLRTSSAHGSTSREEVPFGFVADRGLFWKYVFAALQGKCGLLSRYESALSWHMPVGVRQQFKLARSINVLQMAVDGAPPSLLESEWANASAEVKAVVLQRLTYKIHMQPKDLRSHHLTFIGAHGDASAVSALIPMMRARGNPRSEALVALRSLASRHNLDEPPPDDATFVHWKKWADGVLARRQE